MSVSRFALVMLFGLFAHQSMRADSGPSQVSAALSELSVIPVWSAGLVIVGAGDLALVGLRASATGAQAVLESTLDGSRYSIEVSADLLAHAGALTGRSVVAVSEVAGTSLMVGGQLLLYVPSEMLLVHHHRRRID